MEGLREAADSSNHAVDRRTFLALSTAAVAHLMQGVCAAEEPEGKKILSEDDVKAAMNRIAQLSLDDFREGVEIAGVVIRVPDVKPWGTIVAGDKTWMLRAKHGLAKAFVTRGCVIGNMSWDGEAGELTTVLHPDGPVLPKRKRTSKKVHSFDKTVAMMYALCCDDKDLLLSEADGRPTGMVLTLDPPEKEDAEEEEKKDE